jgi:hypothetical protein
MRTYLASLLVVGSVVGVGCDDDGVSPPPGGPQPPLDRPAVEGDEAVFRPLTTTISVSDSWSNYRSPPSQRMMVTIDLEPVDATTGTVPGLSVLLQGEPLPWTDATPDAAFVPGQTRRQNFQHELPAAAMPADRVLRFVFDYRGSRLRYDLALIPRIVILSPRGSVSTGADEVAMEWTPALEMGETAIDLHTVYYGGDPVNPTVVGTCQVAYADSRSEPSRAVFTRTVAASPAHEPPCSGWATVSSRRSSVVAAPFESLAVRTFHQTTEYLSFAP